MTLSSSDPSRLQVSAGFSWDVGLSALKPAATRDVDSSDGEEQEEGSKVSTHVSDLKDHLVSSPLLVFVCQ